MTLHPRRTRIHTPAALAAAASFTTACMLAACASDPEMDRLVATLPIAATAGSAHHLATIIQQDLDAMGGEETPIDERDKAELRARARVLAHHALSLGEAVERFDPAGKRNTSITLENLLARQAALEAEYTTTFREWGIWQVQHGLRAAEEVPEIFDYTQALR